MMENGISVFYQIQHLDASHPHLEEAGRMKGSLCMADYILNPIITLLFLGAGALNILGK